MNENPNKKKEHRGKLSTHRGNLLAKLIQLLFDRHNERI